MMSRGVCGGIQKGRPADGECRALAVASHRPLQPSLPVTMGKGEPVLRSHAGWRRSGPRSIGRRRTPVQPVNRRTGIAGLSAQPVGSSTLIAPVAEEAWRSILTRDV
jgi:hypothetical protein